MADLFSKFISMDVKFDRIEAGVLDIIQQLDKTLKEGKQEQQKNNNNKTTGSWRRVFNNEPTEDCIQTISLQFHWLLLIFFFFIKHHLNDYTLSN